MMIGMSGGEEVTAANAKGVDAVAMAQAHITCMELWASDEDVLNALDTLVTAVENEQQLIEQIDSAVLTVQERGILTDPDLLDRIYEIGLAAYAAASRSTRVSTLIDIATGKDTQAATLARATLVLGPEEGSEQDRARGKVAATLAAEGRGADYIREHLAELF